MICDPLKTKKRIFFDWDDTVIGVLVIPETWADERPVVNFFVGVNMIHPQLRGADPNSLARTDTYRGIYPHSGPGGGADETVEDGGDYPLTNKLDYKFFARRMQATEDAGGVKHWVEEPVDWTERAAINDPWVEERAAKRAEAKRNWPGRGIYPEEAFYYVVGADGLELRHSLRFLARGRGEA